MYIQCLEVNFFDKIHFVNIQYTFHHKSTFNNMMVVLIRLGPGNWINWQFIHHGTMNDFNIQLKSWEKDEFKGTT